ncbi:protein kinase domain-containing protein [Parafrankia discariae]|uniref:protein kinase domain-containing protein n=1 Tax=Parafrankia discariae TaxID=365528 RepID=UPI00035FE476|nr:protein kinase [Parafrankia discariae]
MIVDRARVAALLPGYELGVELGVGAYGLVLAGRHRGLNRPVAIKVLSAGSDGPVGGFVTEAQLLANMDHPHIVRVHDYVEDDDLCLIVMEMLAGGTLARRRTGMRPEGACAVGLAVAAALTHAHGQGVLHRDIKTDNMLFDTAGLLKVTDFGIAKIMEGSAVTASAVVGTPPYMAPEQILEGRLGPATDLYALATVLYMLLTGAPPFDPKLPLHALWQHHLETVPAPPAGVPTPVAAVIMRNLAKDPAARHPSARAFALHLAGAAADSYGPGWTSRSGVVLRLDDDIRAATDRPATSTTRAGVVAGRTRPEDQRQSVSLSSPATSTSHNPVTATRPDDPPRSSPPSATIPADSDLRTPTRALPPGPETAGPDPSAPRRWLSLGRISPTGRPRWRYQRAALFAAAALAVSLTAVAILLSNRGTGPSTNAPNAANEPTSTPTPTPAVGPIGNPSGVAVGGDGALYLTDYSYNRVWKIDRAGQISTLAGTGTPGFSGDGGPATQAQLNSPLGVAVGGDGALYLTDYSNHRIRKIDRAGQISTLAGTGTPGFSGDGGPATQAQLNSPNGIAIGGDGTLYIADYGNSRIRKIDPAGQISTLAGTGTPGFSGDGGPATQAQLNRLDGVAVGGDGTLYLTDYDNSRIRKIDPAGQISTLAGTGTPGFSGDGGPATQAQFRSPFGVAVGGDGTLYLTDYDNGRIRKIDPAGQISTVAGTGTRGFSGDGGLATQAELDRPFGVAVGGDGTLYLSDSGNSRIRKIDPAGQISTLAQ